LLHTLIMPTSQADLRVSPKILKSIFFPQACNARHLQLSDETFVALPN